MYNPSFNPYNGMQNPYIPTRYMDDSLIRVTGIEGARAYQMNPNRTVALFDNNDDRFYVKSTDGAGFPTIRAFRFQEETSESKTELEYVNKGELVVFKQEVLDYVKQYISESENGEIGATNGVSKSNKAKSRGDISANV